MSRDIIIRIMKSEISARVSIIKSTKKAVLSNSRSQSKIFKTSAQLAKEAIALIYSSGSTAKVSKLIMITIAVSRIPVRSIQFHTVFRYSRQA